MTKKRKLSPYKICSKSYRLLILCLASTLIVSTCKGQDRIKKSTQVVFKKYVISQTFVSEGVAIGDVNNDGKTDILAGHYWYQAPLWERHLLHADTLNPIPGYSTTFLNFCIDVNYDGWADLIRFDQPGAVCMWYENPKNKQGSWTGHFILKTAGNETPLLVDVDRDGKIAAG